MTVLSLGQTDTQDTQGRQYQISKHFSFTGMKKEVLMPFLLKGSLTKFDIVTALIQAPKKEKPTNPTYIHI